MISRERIFAIAYVGDIADVIRFGDDIGTNGGPFMSPTMYRQLFKRRHHAVRLRSQALAMFEAIEEFNHGPPNMLQRKTPQSSY